MVFEGVLKFSDEFNHNGVPDPAKWKPEIGGHGWGNNELQYYTDNLNARVANGYLTIQSRKENFNGRQYTSGRLISKQQFKYGIFEMRAMIPKPVGSWPAFWLLDTINWPNGGEIDIMEAFGLEQGVILGAVHCKKCNGKVGIVDKIRIADPFNTFHVYSLDWNAQRIIVSVDNIPYFTYSNKQSIDTWPFDNAENIIINTAVGGDWAGRKGIDGSSFPWK